ncbi:hypothetical protein AVEN_100696-1 [Araneus ventricosus]|uniref:Uncharacterized protein n=1 Tax=Araneus ventricosus TaxID=182803 RepID=A0A4Y2CU93_ARAVE|nr:hypothetical protein AVEN_100696-1 [Araneus ventricosus]
MCIVSVADLPGFTLHHSWQHRCKLATSCALSLWQICRVSPCTTHGSIAVNLLHRVHCLCGIFAEFHTKFNIRSLFKLAVYLGIAKWGKHVITKARAAQLPMHTV